MTTKIKSKRIKNLFPKFKGRYGGYVCRIHFHDEGRGERYFDSEWGVHNYHGAGQFTLTWMLNYRREFSDSPSGATIGKQIKGGDVLTVHVIKANMRGYNHTHSRTIRVVEVFLVDVGAGADLDKNDQFTVIKYEYL